jgi:hypothetical protein
MQDDDLNLAEKRRRGPPKGSRNHLTHGHTLRKLLLKDVNIVDISKKNGIGPEIVSQAEQICSDAGGKESLSELKRQLINRYVITELLIQSVDHWLLQQPSLIKSKRAIFPIVNERNRLVQTSLQLAQAIGIERKPRPTQSLEEWYYAEDKPAQEKDSQ